MKTTTIFLLALSFCPIINAQTISWGADRDSEFSVTISGTGSGWSGNVTSPSGKWQLIDRGNHAYPSPSGTNFLRFYYFPSAGTVSYVPTGDTLTYETYVDDVPNRVPASNGSSAVFKPSGWWGMQRLTIIAQPDPLNSATWSYEINYYGTGPALVQPPGFFAQPQSAIASVGSDAYLAASVFSGNVSCSRQWRFNGTNLVEGGRWSGVTSSFLTISNVQISDEGNYSLVVSNVAGAVTSAVARLDVRNVFAWGLNVDGQTNIPESILRAKAVAAGAYHNLALCSNAPAGLIAWWRADGNASDAVGNNHGNLSNGVTYASGKVGQAFSFDGINDFIALSGGAVGLPIGKHPRTVEAWVKTTSGGLGEIFSYGSTNNGQAFTVGVWGDSIFVSSWSSPQFSVAAPGLNNGVFHHVAVTYDGTVVQVYCDGILLTTWPFEINTGSWTANIGARISPMEFFLGVIDEVGIYDRALNGNEINAIRLAGSRGKASMNANVIGWGENDLGQIAAPDDLTNAIAIAGGWGFSLALRSDHTATTWGWSEVDTNHFPNGLTNVSAIAAGWDHALALRGDGTVVAWGYGNHSETNVPQELNRVAAISANGRHSLALRNDYSVAAWGDDGAAQANLPAWVTNVAAVAAGDGHDVALRWDGSVIAWGDNSYGQTNVPSDLTNVVAIAVGGSHSLALREDGSVVAWGWNDDGQTNVPPNVTNVIAIAAGRQHSLALLGNGSPVITVQPFSRVALPGDTVRFGAMAAGLPPLSYQWFKDSQPLPNDVHFNGVNSRMLCISNFAVEDIGTYWMLVTNGVGSVITVPVSLNVPKIWFENVRCASLGAFSATICGLPGDVFRVQFSSNLLDWATLCTLTNSSGTIEFTHVGGGENSQRYYRALIP